MGTDSACEPYEFRFRLDDQTTGPADRRALVDFVREQLRSLLIVAEPTYRGRPVRVDGFRLHRDPDVLVSLDPPDTSSPS